MIPYHRPFPLTIDFTDIFESGKYSNGIYCRALESEIERMYNCTCYSCSSGTQGLMILNARLNHEPVHLLSFTWKSVEYMLKMSGSPITYEDIDYDTWLMNYDKHNGYSIRQHTFGNVDVIYYYGIYDGTHALGSKFPNLGKGTVLSLAPTKLITSGEGGLILLKEPNETIKEYRDKCSRMSEFHAKIGLEYLKHLDKMLQWKKKVFEYYKEHLNGRFQEIPYDSNYNTIGMITELKMPDTVEFKKYYEPLKKGFATTDYIYSKIVCLPSWYGCPYKEIVELIEEENK